MIDVNCPVLGTEIHPLQSMPNEVEGARVKVKTYQIQRRKPHGSMDKETMERHSLNKRTPACSK